MIFGPVPLQDTHVYLLLCREQFHLQGFLCRIQGRLVVGVRHTACLAKSLGQAMQPPSKNKKQKKCEIP